MAMQVASEKLKTLKGLVLTFDGPDAVAPGTPITFSVSDVDDLALEGKTIGSRRMEGGEYEVQVRLINLRRACRQRLERLVRPL